jgi:hypothetical protein
MFRLDGERQYHKKEEQLQRHNTKRVVPECDGVYAIPRPRGLRHHHRRKAKKDAKDIKKYIFCSLIIDSYIRLYVFMYLSSLYVCFPRVEMVICIKSNKYGGNTLSEGTPIGWFYWVRGLLKLL